MTFVQPILAAYSNISYNTLETAIFPSYFHGKCQRFSKDGQDPPGCPDPDCPVVCGTPGSLVHFYSTLRYIVFNSTQHTLTALGSPGSDAYDQVNSLVTNAQNSGRKRSVHDNEIARPAERAEDVHSTAFNRHMHIHPRRFRSVPRHHHMAAQLKRVPSVRSILAGITPSLEKACGSPASDSANALPDCNWEAAMKAYILSFPWLGPACMLTVLYYYSIRSAVHHLCHNLAYHFTHSQD